METNVCQPMTLLQQNEAEFGNLKTQIMSIGRVFVAKATGYSEQSITDYVHKRSCSQKLENSIIANLAKALKLKEEAQKEDNNKAWNSLRASLENFQRLS